MEEHPLASLLAGHLADIHRYTHQLKQGIDSDGVHRLRVETKRMRAILRLVRFFQPLFPYRKLYKPFRTLFHAAGALRERQLQIGMLDAVPDIAPAFYRAYRRRLLRELVVARRRLADVLKKDLPSGKAMMRAVEKQFNGLEQPDFEPYFRSKAADIAEFMSEGDALPPGHIHPLRKALKDYNNNRKNTKKALDYDPGPPSVPKGSADLEQTLGEWNDYHTALVHLESAAKRKWAKSCAEDVEALRRYWQGCADALLAQLRAEIQL